MSTFDYLIDHAQKNVWCSPRQDFQIILAPRRLSPKNGSRSTQRVLWTDYALPTKTDWWFVYQIGEITPELIGLGDRKMQWISLMNHCNSELLIADLYTARGLQFPRHESYLLHTLDGNLILAIKKRARIADLNVEQPFLRLYSNAYFSTKDAADTTNGIEVNGFKVDTADNLSKFLAKWRKVKTYKGAAYGFVNGYRVQDLNITTVAIGDLVEYVWDSSIKRVVELPITGVQGFTSSLDRKAKYLLHFPGKQPIETIDYRDDVDFFLIRRTTEAVFKGVYYHKNAEDAVRMVTHRDYSIPVSYVQDYANQVTDLGAVESLSIQMHIREAGFKRPLVNEAHRIKELYKLGDNDLLQAMIGTESTVPSWQADSLESSQYPAIMRALDGEITRLMVQEAYGYNAISKLIADTPQILPTGERWFKLPYGLQHNATVYEYDQDGVLIDWHLHISGEQYAPRSSKCYYIEGIVGLGSASLSTVYNQTNVHLDSEANYRYYVCGLWNNEPDGLWVDVTGDDSYYDIVNGVLMWKVDQTKFYTAIKNDLRFLASYLDLDYRDGILRFTVNVDEVRTDGVTYPGRAELQFGQLDLWMNGRALIEDLDYYVNWPEICLVNKEYLIPGKLQRIQIRATGFCNKDLTRNKPGDIGFVKYGLLSENNRFDIRDDKVLRIVANGRLRHRSQLSFAEADSGVRLEGLRNGAPYQISEIIVPLQGLTDDDTYSLRAKSLVVDKQVSDYMSLKLPEPAQPNPNPIPTLYGVYSPFCSKVIYDLQQKILTDAEVQGMNSDLALRQLLSGYEWLLAYDPVRRGVPDPLYVSIHPHNLKTEITLDVYQWRFLRRAIRLYLNDKVDITKFVRIEEGFEHETDNHPHPYRVLPTA